MNRKRNDWHTGAYAALRLDLNHYKDILDFDEEYSLTSLPLKIDILILKKISEQIIPNGIGSLFRKYNVIEYKSR